MRVLGVVLSANLTMGNHLDAILSSSASSIHALHMPRSCGLGSPQLHVIARSTTRHLFDMPPLPGGVSPPPGIKTGWRSWLVGSGFIWDDAVSCRLGCGGVSNPGHVLSRPPSMICALRPMVSPSLKRIIVILSLGCFLKLSIVSDFLVCGLSGFLTF